MKRIGVWVGLLCLVACHAERRPEAQVAKDLTGLTLPLNADGRLKLEVAGKVGEVPAQVALEVSEPLSLIADGCFPEGAPESKRTVRVPRLVGGFSTHPEIAIPVLSLGEGRLVALRARLVPGVKACRVTLGSDVLDAFALDVDVVHRRVTFRKPGYVPPQDPSREVTRIALSRDPQTDWPLLAVRVVQGQYQLTGPLALQTDSTRTHLGKKAATEAGLRTALDLLGSLDLKLKLPISKEVVGTFVTPDAVELAPGVSLPELDVSLLPDWDRQSPLGTLGTDGWGRFDAVIDPSSHALWLSRPRRVGKSAGMRCGAEGDSKAVSCFQLDSQRRAGATRAVVTIWRNLPKGGRVELEPLGKDGKVLETSCRVGLTFSPQPGGASLAQTFPWPSLQRAMPECAQALAQADRLQFAIWSEGVDRTCPGSCGFASEPQTGRTVCSCEQSPEAQFEALRPFLDHVREVLGRNPAPTAPEEKEPDAP